ncbi:hypothetical protein [Streptococcus sanguinis]|uniref:hypothetical protein n=2 Tax=Streptococcus sanguinis TaxID=1305 RepID=UPI001D14DF82|nr:hypothetical protein [Streptococcus sanguinis]MCC3167927.1 putative membrane protein [Streptococcus sanguinis]
MEASQIITLLSGAGLGAILSAILVFVSNNKSRSLEYMSEEHLYYRNNLRIIIKDLYSLEDVQKSLNELKLLLDAKGKRIRMVGGYSIYLKDGHIWILVNRIESELKNNGKASKELIEKLISYLELLLDYELSTSRKKVRYKLFETFVFISLALGTVLSIIWFIKPNWRDANGDIIACWIPLICLILFLISFFLFYFLRDSLRLSLGNGNSFLTMIFLIFYLLPSFVIIQRYNENAIEALSRISFLENIDKDKFIFIIRGALSILEILFLIFSVDDVKNQYIEEIRSVENADIFEYLLKINNAIENEDESSSLRKNQYIRRFQKSLAKKNPRKLENMVLEKQEEMILEEEWEKVISDLQKENLWKKSLYKKEITYLDKYLKDKI